MVADRLSAPFSLSTAGGVFSLRYLEDRIEAPISDILETRKLESMSATSISLTITIHRFSCLLSFFAGSCLGLSQGGAPFSQLNKVLETLCLQQPKGCLTSINYAKTCRRPQVPNFLRVSFSGLLSEKQLKLRQLSGCNRSTGNREHPVPEFRVSTFEQFGQSPVCDTLYFLFSSIHLFSNSLRSVDSPYLEFTRHHLQKNLSPRQELVNPACSSFSH